MLFGLLGIAIAGGGGASGPAIALSDNSIPEDAEVGDLVGTLSVNNGSGDYSFTLTDDAGGLFALDGSDDTRLEVAGALDFETAPTLQITVEADNGVDDPISREFTITVTNVAIVPAAFEVGDWDVDGGDQEADVTIDDLPESGDDAVTDVEYRLDGGAWISSGGTVSFTITGLTNDVEYDVQLRAVNAIGAGAASDTKSVTPTATPSGILDRFGGVIFDRAGDPVVARGDSGGGGEEDALFWGSEELLWGSEPLIWSA